MPQVTSYDQLSDSARKLYDFMLDWLIERVADNRELASLLPPGVTFSRKAAERDRLRRFLLTFVRRGVLRLAGDKDSLWWEVRRDTSDAWKVFGEHQDGGTDA